MYVFFRVLISVRLSVSAFLGSYLMLGLGICLGLYGKIAQSPT